MYRGRLGRADGLCVTFWRTSGSLLSLRNLIMRTKSGRTVTENWELKCMEERNNPTAQPWVEDKAVL